MQEEDRKWVKWILIAVIVGGAVGMVLKQIFVKILPAPLALIPAACIPVCIILGLLIVLYMYQREKENIFGK